MRQIRPVFLPKDFFLLLFLKLCLWAIFLQNVQHSRSPHTQRDKRCSCSWRLHTTAFILLPRTGTPNLLWGHRSVPSIQCGSNPQPWASLCVRVFPRHESRRPVTHDSTYSFFVFWWRECEKRVCQKGLYHNDMTNTVCETLFVKQITQTIYATCENKTNLRQNCEKLEVVKRGNDLN